MAGVVGGYIRWAGMVPEGPAGHLHHRDRSRVASSTRWAAASSPSPPSSTPTRTDAATLSAPAPSLAVLEPAAPASSPGQRDQSSRAVVRDSGRGRAPAISTCGFGRAWRIASAAMSDLIEIRGLRALGHHRRATPRSGTGPSPSRSTSTSRPTSPRAGAHRRPGRHRRLRAGRGRGRARRRDRAAPAHRARRPAHRRGALDARTGRRRPGHGPQAPPAAPARRHVDGRHHPAGAARRDPGLPRPRLQPRRPRRLPPCRGGQAARPRRRLSPSTRPTRSAAPTARVRTSTWSSSSTPSTVPTSCCACAARWRRPRAASDWCTGAPARSTST